jgi:hypothetical protein
MITTKIGIILTIFGNGNFVIIQQKFALFRKKQLTSNSEYLKDLLAIKAKQQFMQTITMLNLYFVLLSTELVCTCTDTQTIMSNFFEYLLWDYSIWILFNWFYLRPKQIKINNLKMNKINNKFEIIKLFDKNKNIHNSSARLSGLGRFGMRVQLAKHPTT